jgi:NADPH2:quinone reductase
MRSDLTELFNLAQLGHLTVTVGGRYRLDRVAEAHRALESRLTTGKVVLIP